MESQGIIKYKKVTTKSRAGVKYTKYVPFFDGEIIKGISRAALRLTFRQIQRNYKGKGWLGTGRKNQPYDR